MNPVLNLPAPRAGIDFMAYTKGMELARDMNWRDELQRQKRQEMYDSMDAADQNRQAAAYMATIQGNLQDAVAAGMSPTDFLTAQMQQIRNDPNFQGFAPEVQAKVFSALTDSAALHMAGLQRAGMTPEANRLAQAFGITLPTSPVDVALQTGDVGQITNALKQQFGLDLQVSDDGQFATVAGQQVPLPHILQTLARHQLPGSLPSVAAQAHDLAAADARQRQAIAEQQALIDRQIEAYRQGFAANPQSGAPSPIAPPLAPGGGFVTPQQAVLGQAFGQTALPNPTGQPNPASQVPPPASQVPPPASQVPLPATPWANWRDAFPLP